MKNRILNIVVLAISICSLIVSIIAISNNEPKNRLYNELIYQGETNNVVIEKTGLYAITYEDSDWDYSCVFSITDLNSIIFLPEDDEEEDNIVFVFENSICSKGDALITSVYLVIEWR